MSLASELKIFTYLIKKTLKSKTFYQSSADNTQNGVSVIYRLNPKFFHDSLIGNPPSESLADKEKNNANTGVEFFVNTHFNAIRNKNTNEEKVKGLIDLLGTFQNSVDQQKPNPPVQTKDFPQKDVDKESHYGQGFPYHPNSIDGSSNLVSSPHQNLPVSDPKGLIEMLFIQRSVNANDLHSGQIAFPGGRCDNDENDKIASQREAHEEVGLDLHDNTKFLYLGKLDKNFFIYRRKNKNCWIGVNLFFCLSVDDIEVRESMAEVRTHFWVPLNWFYHSTSSKLVDLTTKRDPMMFPGGAGALKSMYHCIENVESKKWIDDHKDSLVLYDYWTCGYKMPNGMTLWGLTLYMVTSLVEVT
jgi:8-oxo-dGTP pyrophosphatase MutT (NUDIX family)